MKKYIGLIVALFGFALMVFKIYVTAKEDHNAYPFLLPLGLLLCMGGAFYNNRVNAKK